MTYPQTLRALKSHYKPENIAGRARFGIIMKKALWPLAPPTPIYGTTPHIPCAGRVSPMDSFWIAFFSGVAAGQIILIGIIHLCRIDLVRRLVEGAGQWTTASFWRGVELLLSYLEELLARKRECEAGDLGSPNLVSRTEP